MGSGLGLYKTVAQGQAGQNERYIDGQYGDHAITRQGAVITMDQILAWTIAGRTFHCQQGDAITLVDFVETSYDEDQPQLAIIAPAGTTMIPLSLSFNFQDQAGTNNHVAVSTTTNDIGAGTSTSLTVSSMRRDAPHGAKCTANSLYTGNATAATGLIEIARNIDPFVATAAGRLPGFRWDIKTSSVIPVLVGPATLQVHAYAASDGVEGFSESVWVEMPTPDLLTLNS
jgi:hypothetical protein